MASKSFSTINTGLSNLPLEVKDPQTYAELVRVYNAIKIVAQSLDTYTGIGTYPQSDWASVGNTAILAQNQNKLYPVAADNFSTGMMVCLYDVGGVTYAKQAKAGNGDVRPCHAFCTGNVTANGSARVEVVLMGLYPYAGGLQAGQKLFLSNGTYGAFTLVTPSGVGNIRQAVGFAVSPNAFYFNPTVDYTTL